MRTYSFKERGNVIEKKVEIVTDNFVNLNEKSYWLLQDSLQKDFGVKTGEMLWSYCRGLDLRSVTAVQVCLTVDFHLFHIL